MWLIGNWKMHTTHSFLASFVEGLTPPLCGKIFPVLCPPFPYMAPLHALLQQKAWVSSQGHALFSLGAQDISLYKEGAHTGEVSGAMLVDVGSRYVLVGHGERQETSQVVMLKAHHALQAGLCPIICLGEAQEENWDALRNQGEERLGPMVTAETLAWRFSQENPPPFMVAYEPLWSIGAPQPPGLDYLKTSLDTLGKILRSHGLQNIPLLYGGAVNTRFCMEIFPQLALQGLLVGRASLCPKTFCDLMSLMM